MISSMFLLSASKGCKLVLFIIMATGCSDSRKMVVVSVQVTSLYRVFFRLHNCHHGKCKSDKADVYVYYVIQALPIHSGGPLYIDSRLHVGGHARR